MSNRHHLQQPHKEPTHAIGSAIKTIQARQDIKHNPYKYLSNTLVVCKLLHPNHLIPNGKHIIILFSEWDVVCLCIQWVVQNTKHPFLIHAGSVYTLCVFLNSIHVILREAL